MEYETLSDANLAFGERLKSSREHLGLSQQQLAAMIKTSQSSISLWENGVNGARGACVFQLADALQVDARWLATGGGQASGLKTEAGSVQTWKYSNGQDALAGRTKLVKSIAPAKADHSR